MRLVGPGWPWRADREGRTIVDMVPRWLRFALGAALVAAATGCMMIRAAGHDPARWHVDPATAERTGKPNDYLVAPEGTTAAPVDRVLGVLGESPAAVMARLDAVARAAPRTEVVAGTPEELFVTYVQRSKWIGFPDYVSVKAVPVEGGGSLIVWSRARYGYSDLGVNADRVERWLAEMGEARGRGLP